MMSNNSPARKRYSFYIILVLLPFVLLASAEVLLRISGFGYSYPLFIKAQSLEGYLQPNPELIKRYFSNPDLAPTISPDTVYFKQNKPPNTYRIVVQGGSSAAGFPYGRFGSLSGMLSQRFKRLYPDRNIEIINTAMSAVNSYTLLDLTDEIIAIDPDLIVIYAGHNEFLGIMGVGSTFAARGGRNATLLFLKFRDLRLFQLMQRLMQLFVDKPDASDTTDRTLMAEVARGQTIIFNSDLYQQGVAQFSDNLDLLLSAYQQQSIPVVLGTLASNEKDQKPFASTTGEHSADSLFKRAEILHQQGRFAEARAQFQLARDRDLLRFRAPTEFNEIIRSKQKDPLVYIADSDRKIRADSDDGIIGFEHMLEHLHPNSRGYFLLAEAFVETINQHRLIATPREYPLNQAWLDIPLTEVDKIIADLKVRQLTSDYPFKEQVLPPPSYQTDSYDFQVAQSRLSGVDWLQSKQDMLQAYQQQGRFRDAAKVAALIFDAFPTQHQVAYVAGQLYFRISDYAMALYYHRLALAAEPENVNYMLMTARSSYMTRDLVQAMELLESVLQLAPANIQARQQLQRIRQEYQSGNDTL